VFSRARMTASNSSLGTLTDSATRPLYAIGLRSGTIEAERGGIGPQCPSRHLRFIRPLLAPARRPSKYSTTSSVQMAWEPPNYDTAFFVVPEEVYP
jgi:hypothetical protein